MEAGAIEEQVRARFPEGTIQRVLLLRHGDDPAIEPGRVGIRVVIGAADAAAGGEPALEAFHHAHQAAIKQLAHDLPRLLPGPTRLEFTDGEHTLFLMGLGAPEERPGELTPVMARLGPADLETLDTLITAGVATNRAEAVRWALGRIRERPAYEQLRARVRDIEELKSQF